MLQLDQFRLPIGFKFTKRLWSHQDFKRRTDYSMQIEWSNKEYYYSIQVNYILLRKQFSVRDSLFPKTPVIHSLTMSFQSTGLEMRKNNLGEDLESAFSSINKARLNKKLYLISVGQDIIFGFKVPQVKSHRFHNLFPLR